MRTRTLLIVTSAVIAGSLIGCGSPNSGEAMSKPLSPQAMQERGIGEGAAPSMGGNRQDPGQAVAPQGGANAAQGDL